MYCTYLTIYFGDKLPRRYIGSTTVKRITEECYNGSVKSKKYKAIYLSEQAENKHLFKTRILETFDTHQKAVEAELLLQLRYNVVRSERYMNMSYAQPNGCFGRDISGENHPMFGAHHSELTRQRISGAIRRNVENGSFISPFSSMDFNGENNPFFGRTHSEASKVKMRKPKTKLPKWICPHCQKMYDSGNLSQHLKRTLQWSNERINEYKQNTPPVSFAGSAGR